MGQNQVALAMYILDTPRYPRFANVAQKNEVSREEGPRAGFRPFNLNTKKSLADCSTSD